MSDELVNEWAIKIEKSILGNGEMIKSPVGNGYFESKGKVRAAPIVLEKKLSFCEALRPKRT